MKLEKFQAEIIAVPASVTVTLTKREVAYLADALSAGFDKDLYNLRKEKTRTNPRLEDHAERDREALQSFFSKLYREKLNGRE